MNKRLRVVLVGAGRISRRHEEALAELPELFELRAVCDPKAERLESSSAPHKYLSYDEMMTHTDADLVVILTESGNHHVHALDLLRWGKPVLIEKPFALSAANSQEILRRYKAQGVPVFVVKQNRLNPPVASVLQEIRQGSLGRINFASASVLWCREPDYYLADEWRLSKSLDGGVIWNQASHYVDLLHQVLGDVESVFAIGSNFASPAETDDTVFAVLRASSGAIGSIQATTTIRPKNYEGTLTVVGELGIRKIGGHALNVLMEAKTGENKEESANNTKTTADVYGKSHARLYEELHRDLTEKTTSQFRGDNAVGVVEIMEAIQISAQERREVFLAEVRARTPSGAK